MHILKTTFHVNVHYVWFQNRRAKFRKTERVIQPDTTTTTIVSTTPTTTPPNINNIEQNSSILFNVQHTSSMDNSMYNSKLPPYISLDNQENLCKLFDSYNHTVDKFETHQNREIQIPPQLSSSLDDNNDVDDDDDDDGDDDELKHSKQIIGTLRKKSGQIKFPSEFYPPLKDSLFSMIQKSNTVQHSIIPSKSYLDWTSYKDHDNNHNDDDDDGCMNSGLMHRTNDNLHPLYKLTQTCRQVDRLVVGTVQHDVTSSSFSKKSLDKQHKFISRKK
ncbi:unnamed protein product [Schistosoma turkestanicum]|nr:unnamed protein product [Schistosoma turkestanicum]